MKLIIESGATKTDFSILDVAELQRFRLGGINLATMPEKDISEILESAIEKLESVVALEQIEEIFFYGAGLVPTDTGGMKEPSVSVSVKKIDEILRRRFCKTVSVEYNSDLTASARSLWGRESGISVILGTGSNSCFFDGCRVISNVRPCGYIIGDFGSGAALGKTFLADFLQNQMPENLSARVEEDYALDYKSVVSNLYNGVAPARYLASFAPYILSLTKEKGLDTESLQYLEEIITENFRVFIRRCLLQYDTSMYSVRVTGSFGCAARNYLEKAGADFGVRFTKFLSSPIDGLIKYHSENV